MLRDQTEHWFRSVNKNVNNATFLQMARISLQGWEIDYQNNGRNVSLFDFENCLIDVSVLSFFLFVLYNKKTLQSQFSMPTLCTIVHRSKKSVGELNPLHPPPRYFTILSLKFAPVGSASDPLNQQVNHVTVTETRKRLAAPC